MQELDLKSKTIEDLSKKVIHPISVEIIDFDKQVKGEEAIVGEWHKKVEALRKSVLDAEEEAALTRKRYEK